MGQNDHLEVSQTLISSYFWRQTNSYLSPVVWHLFSGMSQRQQKFWGFNNIPLVFQGEIHLDLKSWIEYFPTNPLSILNCDPWLHHPLCYQSDIAHGFPVGRKWRQGIERLGAWFDMYEYFTILTKQWIDHFCAIPLPSTLLKPLFVALSSFLSFWVPTFPRLSL